MAYLRRHWRATALQAALFIIIGASVVVLGVATRGGGQAAAQDVAQTQEGASADSVDPVNYGHVQLLREGLGLTTADLAALSCTQEQAAQVLRALCNWVEQNAAASSSAKAAEDQARKALRVAFRDIHVGPRDELLIRSIANLEQNLHQAVQQRKSLQNGAATPVASLLSSTQTTMWERARMRPNILGAEAYRYLSSLTDEQAENLDVTLRRRSSQSTPQDHALTAEQLREVDEIQARIQASMAVILEAEKAVFPLPEREDDPTQLESNN